MSFINKAIAVHGNKYDYSKTIYVKSKSKVIITCKEHGDFSQTPSSHLSNHGCPNCGRSKVENSRRTSHIDVISSFREVHGDKYDYSLVDFVSVNNKIKIKCKEHGVFEQKPYNHRKGEGCPGCGLLRRSTVRKNSMCDTIKAFQKVHGDKYDYSLVKYVNSKQKVKIKCKEHGVFEQMPNDHSRGIGCPSCAIRHSNAELEILEMLKSLNVDCVHGDRSLIGPYELDVYIPQHNLAIEYNGLRWHSEEFGKDKDYHKNKTDMCREKGVRLVHIWEDEWNKDKQLQLDFIKNLVCKDERKKVYARKTTVGYVTDKSLVKDTLNNHHIQGSCSYTQAVGLWLGDELVTVTCFTKRGDTFELVRHVSTCAVIGSLGKTVTFFGESVYTFCDLSRFDGHSYVKAGFKLVSEIKPDYKYVVSGQRSHKFNWRRNSIQSKLPEFYNVELTEKQMMLNAGISRIWDCGKTRYEY